MTKSEAKDLKEQQIRLCEKYIKVARSLNLDETSTSMRYWTQQLHKWQNISIYLIMEKF